MNGMLCQSLTVYKGPRLVADTQFTTSSRNPREFSSLDNNMCCKYGSSCGYGCGYGPYYGCGYGSCCGYGTRYGCGCGYGSGCCGYRPFCCRRCYSSCR
ncbi:keratin-associated protein 21-1-like [Lynx canadensis]|uniref:keratin-associated protein 21-1-like n=1 Tax=Lynx canadensis TaxID=61383 RepID=UPI0011AFF8BF|nr:keratin-associated protein 21-1-like [Lynx canadensis]